MLTGCSTTSLRRPSCSTSWIAPMSDGVPAKLAKQILDLDRIGGTPAYVLTTISPCGASKGGYGWHLRIPGAVLRAGAISQTFRPRVTFHGSSSTSSGKLGKSRDADARRSCPRRTYDKEAGLRRMTFSKRSSQAAFTGTTSTRRALSFVGSQEAEPDARNADGPMGSATTRATLFGQSSTSSRKDRTSRHAG